MTDIPALIRSLKYSHHKVITSAKDNGKLVELLAVQITRDNLDVVIEALSSGSAHAARIAELEEEAANQAKELAAVLKRSTARIAELEAAAALPLPEEIAGLIEGLTDILTGLKSGRFGQREIWEGHLKEAISRLAASALPGEIAGLIERAEAQAMSRWGGPNNEHKNCLEWHLAAALQRLARENVMLKDRSHRIGVEVTEAFADNQRQRARIAELEVEAERRFSPEAMEAMDRENTRLCEGWAAQSVRAEKAEARIAELEAHCVRLGQGGAERYWEERWRTLQAEQDAIRAKMIEECLNTTVTVRGFGTASDDYLNGFHDGADAKTDSIRALALSEAEVP
jgi:hypothetical protein